MTSEFSYQLTAPRTLERRLLAREALPADWVRVRVAYASICGSDLSKFEGRRSIAYPTTLGHEFVGVVEEVGEAVSSFQPGDVVTSDLNHRCGRCYQCQAGRSHLCVDGQVGRFSNRAFSSSLSILESYLFKVNAPPSPQFALAEPLSCVIHAKQWAQISGNDRVLIIGAGGLGLCMSIALTAQWGPRFFAVTDRNQARLGRVQQILGHDPSAIEPERHTYSVVFDLSGSAEGLRAATQFVEPGGRLCTMSHLDGISSADFLLESLTRRDITFTVSYLNGEPEKFCEAVSMLAGEWGDQWDSALEIVPIADLDLAFQERRTSHFNKTIIDVR